MKNYWLNKEKEECKESFLYELQQQVEVDLTSGPFIGTIVNRFASGDLNWYSIKTGKEDEDLIFYVTERRIKPYNWRTLPKYVPGGDKLFEHNYEVVVKEDTAVTLNRKTFCPQKTLQIDLKLQYDGQHDGHLWTKDWKEQCDSRLVEEIFDDVKKQIKEFVANVNPFSIHC